MIPSTFSKRRGATVPGVVTAALVSLVLFSGAGTVPIQNFAPQGTMQSDLNAGGHSITNAGTLSTTNLVVNGTNFTGGTTGPQGPAGTNGTNGATGATGPQGPAGANGTNGTNGTNGASYTLPVATATTLGGVKQGTNVSIAGDGTISSSGGSANVTGLRKSAGAGSSDTAAVPGTDYLAPTGSGIGLTGLNSLFGNNITVSGPGTAGVTLNPSGRTSHDFLTFTGSTGSFNLNVAVTDTNALSGDDYWIDVAWSTTCTPTINFYDSTSSGTFIDGPFVGTAAGGYSKFHLVFNGTAWVKFPQGALETRSLGAGVQNATKLPTNLPGGFLVLDASGNLNAVNGLTANNPTQNPIMAFGFDAGLYCSGVSADGHSFSALQSLPPNSPNGTAPRDPRLLTNVDGTARLVNGLYWVVNTTGNFGNSGVFEVDSTPDFIHYTHVTYVPITGISGEVTTTANQATVGSATITLPSTAISGLTNGTVYTISGAAGIPPGACFAYNSASATQTLGYQASSTAVAGTVVTTAALSSAAIKLDFVNNTWSPCWFVDTDGTVGVYVRASSVNGSSLGTPGMGYLTCSNPTGTNPFTTWSAFTAMTMSAGSSGSATNPALSYNNGSIYVLNGTYYWFGDSGGGTLWYATASSARGAYTMQGKFNFVSGTYNLESNMPINLDGGIGNYWRCYCASPPYAYYTETTTGLAGTWSNPVQINYAGNVMAGMQGIPITNTNFALTLLTASQEYNLGQNAMGVSGSGNTGVTSILLPGAQNDFYAGATPGSGSQGYVGSGAGTRVLRLLNGGGPQGNWRTEIYTQNVSGYSVPILINDTTPGTNTQNDYIFFDHNENGSWAVGDAGGKFTVGDEVNFVNQMQFTAGAGTTSISAFAGLVTAANSITSLGNLVSDTAGKGVQVKEGTNAKQGTATLASGTVTVSNTSVTSTSRIQLTGIGLNSSTALGILDVPTITAGTGFVITSYVPGGTSTQTGDLRTVNYEIFESAP